MLTTPKPFASLGHIFLSSFRLFNKTWMPLFPLTVLLSISMLSPDFFLYNPTTRLLFVGYFVFSIFTFACVVYYTALQERGNTPLFKDVLYFVLKKLFIILLAVTATMLFILLGYAFFIIPGIIVTVWFSMSLPLILLDDAGPFDVLRKSYELTTDHWMRTAVVIFVPAILVSLIGAAIFEGFRLNFMTLTHYRIFLGIFIFLTSIFYLPWIAALIVLQFEDLKKRQATAQLWSKTPQMLHQSGEANL